MIFGIFGGFSVDILADFSTYFARFVHFILVLCILDGLLSTSSKMLQIVLFFD